tara:strand:- start:834 stop:1172 length:339 start_codon:yes stop_codon:yes gene_type:complete
MAKRIQDKEHLLYVKTLPCMICKAGFISHSKVVQAHHLLRPKSGMRGFGLKANDNECVPLCMYHHAKLHTKFGDEYKFFRHYGFKENAEQEYAAELWERTLWNREHEDDLPF